MTSDQAEAIEQLCRQHGWTGVGEHHAIEHWLEAKLDEREELESENEQLKAQLGLARKQLVDTGFA